MRKIVAIGAFVTACVFSGLVGAMLFGIGGSPASAALDNCKDCLFGVTANGQKLNSRGVKKVERISLGHYEVTFKKTIEGCALLATAVNLPDDSGVDAYITANLTVDPKVVVYSAFTATPGGHQAVDVTFTGVLLCL